MLQTQFSGNSEYDPLFLEGPGVPLNFESESDSNPENPVTFEEYKRQGGKICRKLSDMAPGQSLSPPFKKMIRACVVGGLSQAYAAKVAFEDLAKTDAAQKARTARQKAQRHQVKLGGGVLYQAEARAIKKHREDEEVKKAEGALERARSALKRAERAKRKPFLDEIRARFKQRAERKRIMKALCVEIRKRGRGRRV